MRGTRSCSAPTSRPAWPQVGQLAGDGARLRPLSDARQRHHGCVVEQRAERVAAADRAHLSRQYNRCGPALFDRDSPAQRVRPIASVRPLRLSGPQSRVSGRGGQRHRAGLVLLCARRRGRLLEDQRPGGLQLTRPDDRRADEAGPHGARLGVVVLLRPLQRLRRRYRIRRDLGGGATRRGHAAALVKGANPSLGPNELQAYLESHAIDLGVPGRDGTYGAGKLALGPVATAGTTGVCRPAASRRHAGGCAIANRPRRLLGRSRAPNTKPAQARPGRLSDAGRRSPGLASRRVNVTLSRGRGPRPRGGD